MSDESIETADIYRHSPDLVTRRIVGETLVVPISGKLADLEEVFNLNVTGAFVWERLDGGTALEDIRDGMALEFEVEPETAWCDLRDLVAELLESGLVEKI